MAEYLDRTAFKEEYLCCGYLPEMSEEEFDAFPDANVAPVVRCQDCKHAWIHPCGYVYCHRDGRNAYEMTFDLDSFCSYGERKAGAE